MLLMLYARDDATLDAFMTAELGSATPRDLVVDGAFRVLHVKHTTALDDQKEHFGWRDGLSMPVIANG